MIDYINIGSTPSDEDCAQVGSPDFQPRARREMKAYINQLRRVYGKEPEGALLKIRWFPHDFGTYGEVVCDYNDTIPEAVEYAFKVEAGCAEWDSLAREELGL